jgi:hypothetical protein
MASATSSTSATPTRHALPARSRGRLPAGPRSLRERSRRGTRPLTLVAVWGVPLLLACGGENLKPEPIVDDPNLYWDLALNHHAVTLGTEDLYDTLQLVATPRNYRSEPLDGLPAPRYISRDQEKVLVTNEGLLVAQAITPSDAVWVVATVTTNNLKHQDSVSVRVISASPQPVLTTFSIRPGPGDSAKVALASPYLANIGFPDEQEKTLPLRMMDSNGVPLNDLGLMVYYRSSDPAVASLSDPRAAIKDRRVIRSTSPMVFSGRITGTTTFTAEATVFGVTKADTVAYRIGWPVLAVVPIIGPDQGLPPGSFFTPGVTVAPGGMVLWIVPPEGPDATILTDVTFADADLPHVAAPTVTSPPWPSYLSEFCSLVPVVDCVNEGNLVLGFDPVSGAGSFAAVRRFPDLGTYRYSSTRHGTVGRVVVAEDP